MKRNKESIWLLEMEHSQKVPLHWFVISRHTNSCVKKQAGEVKESQKRLSVCVCWSVLPLVHSQFWSRSKRHSECEDGLHGVWSLWLKQGPTRENKFIYVFFCIEKEGSEMKKRTEQEDNIEKNSNDLGLPTWKVFLRFCQTRTKRYLITS